MRRVAVAETAGALSGVYEPVGSDAASRGLAGSDDLIVLDANVLISHLDARDPHHATATALLEATDARPLGAITITLTETLAAPARAKQLDAAKVALERLGVEELALGSDAPAKLAKLRAESGRKLPVCRVLQAARQHGGMVASFDDGLVKAAGQLGLAILEP